MLKHRAINTTAAAAFAVAVTIFAPAPIFVLVIGLVASLAFNEFIRMTRVQSDVVLYTASLSLFVVLGLTVLVPSLDSSALGLSLGPLVLLGVGLLRQRLDEQYARWIAWCIVGMVYVGAMLYFMSLIRMLPQGREAVLVLGIGTGMRDAGAYLWGRVIPRGHPIRPLVSPKKTYEGALASCILTMAVVLISGAWLLPHRPLWQLAIMGLLIALFGQIGDLVESWLKRVSSAKDSGQFFPGQGGVLDAVDGLIYTAPVVFLLLRLIS